MRRAEVKVHDLRAGVLSEEDSSSYIFAYDEDYDGSAVSLTMPVRSEPYLYDSFPAFFDGLLPEGIQLDGLLRIIKIDKYDYLEQLIATGGDMIGAVTVYRINDDE